VVISAGGKLQKICQEKLNIRFDFTTRNNPCGSPGWRLGFSIVGQLILFSKLGI
jgi:hypothetical protein